jgi:mevalonate kinase
MNMYRLHDEPKLNELLADPILHLLLKRDGVSLEELQDLIEQARRRRWGAKRTQLQ